ncbi:MAG: hypothetical protein K6F52_05310 [Clostridia bacterium]|nr:hypothetical protein [Clostridia bacterium]
MPISSVTQVPSQVAVKSADYAASSISEAKEQSSEVATEMVKDVVKKDEFVRNDSQGGVTTYSNTGKLTADQVGALKNSQIESYKNFISNMFRDQMKNFSGSVNMNFSMEFSFSMEITATQEASAEAKDDPWSVDSVATRIMDMAMALTGGDSSKIDLMRQAVEDGFKAAGLEWGSELPDISNQTYDEIMKRFEYWEKNGSLDNYVMSDEPAETAAVSAE